MSQLTDFFYRVEPEFITSDLSTVLLISGTYSVKDLTYVLSYANQSSKLKHIVLISNDFTIAQAIPLLERQYPQLHFSFSIQQRQDIANVQLKTQSLGLKAHFVSKFIALLEYLTQFAWLDIDARELFKNQTIDLDNLKRIWQKVITNLSNEQQQHLRQLGGEEFVTFFQNELQSLDNPTNFRDSAVQHGESLDANSSQSPSEVEVNHLCFYPKTKDELLEILQQWQLVKFIARNKNNTISHHWLQQAEHLVALQREKVNIGQLFLVGTNDSGIKTLSKFTEPEAHQLFNSNRVRMFSLDCDDFALTEHALQKSKISAYNLGDELASLESKKPQGKQIASLVRANASPSDSNKLSNLLRKIATINIFSTKGIFSPEHLDTGTQVLLKSYLDFELEANKNFIASVGTTNDAALLDYGCGSGVISVFLDFLLQEFYPSQGESCVNPELMWNWMLFDVSYAALNSAKFNLRCCRGKAHFLWGTSLTNYQELEDSFQENKPQSKIKEQRKYQHIIANPRFHTGNQQTFTIVDTLIADAKNQLLPNGTLRMVANEGLPYLPMLRKHFKHVTELARESGFVVYFAYN